MERAIPRLLQALWLGEHRVALAWSDETRGVVDLAERCCAPGGLYAALREPHAFSRFVVDGTLIWPGPDLDIAPETLHRLTAAAADAAGRHA